jgi:hypothetical protein
MALESSVLRWSISPLLMAALTVIGPVAAYEYPVSPESVREAYFIGSNRDEKTAALMGQYVHRFPVPSSGPYVAEIRLETPFVQIVERARQFTNYTAQDATEEFLNKPGVLHLIVKIYFTPSYSAILESKNGKTTVRTDDFWREFKIRLIQGSEIHADAVRAQPVYAASEKGMRRLTGAEIEADYTAESVGSERTDIEVLSPDGAKVKTTFDLSALR